MFEALRHNIKITWVFLFIRFLASLVVCALYIAVAAFIQNIFVRLLGESTFNYIAGGIAALVLGVVVCTHTGSLVFMFVKGWHVSALAYAPKIRKRNAPALAVGIKAFNHNLISFGAVYGVRALLNKVIKGFKDTLWDFMDDVPGLQILKNFANHPIVEYIASDTLHYGFDAAVFYLVRHKPKDIGDVPGTVSTAIIRYVCCLPSILASSVATFILFRFIPKVAKWILVLAIFITQGFTAGVFGALMMYPLFYILDNALFDPLTMTVFLSAYAAKCEEEPDMESPLFKAVEAILDDQDMGSVTDFLHKEKGQEEGEPTDNSDGEAVDAEETVAEEKIQKAPKPDISAASDWLKGVKQEMEPAGKSQPTGDLITSPEDDESDFHFGGETIPGGMSDMSSLSDMVRKAASERMEVPRTMDPDVGSDTELFMPDMEDLNDGPSDVFTSTAESKPEPPKREKLSSLAELLGGADLSFDPMGGDGFGGESEEPHIPMDRATKSLAGDEDD